MCGERVGDHLRNTVYHELLGLAEAKNNIDPNEAGHVFCCVLGDSPGHGSVLRVVNRCNKEAFSVLGLWLGQQL